MSQSESLAARPPLVLLIALVAFGPMSIDLYLPSLPDLTRVFHTEVSRVQLTLSVFVAGFAVAQLIYGPLSDRYGRRPVLLGGVAIYCLASLFCLTAQSIDMLIVGRFLQSLGACSGPVLGRAILRDSYPREQAAKVMASMASVMALAPAVAPMIGGNLHALFGWQANFVLLVVFGLVMLLSSWRFLTETNRHLNLLALQPLSMLENYLSLFRDPVFLGYSLTLSFGFGAMFSFISGASFVIIDLLKVPPQHFGFCFLAVILGFMSGSFISARISHRIGLERMVVIGSLIGAGAGLILLGLALGGVVSVVSVVAPVVGVFFAAGFMLPNSTALAIAPHARIAGSASALLGFLQMGAASLTGWMVGRLDNGTTLPMAAVVAGCSVMATLCLWSLISRRENR